ncbi:leucine-rich repeat protein [uncultured Alistipes sp.]|uniref:leucine-rich repeat protein n=1 Tax=uncultured Alistipes sp. TaxID=538949 RepID=UPI00259B1EFF|nr:leucine-rich repeat protein [uncultured Alistipes sp.]
MKKLFFYLSLLGVMLSGCGKSDEPTPDPKPNPDTPSTQTSITISPSSLTFDADYQTTTTTWQHVVIHSSDNWSVTGGTSWCKTAITEGKPTDNIVPIVIEPNTSPDERNATLTFICGDKTAKLVVTQKQQDALTVTSSKVEVDAQGGPINVEVKANIPFEYVIADKDKGWITPVETKSMQTTVLSFNVAQNENTQKREGTITIKSGELSETVTVYQAGAQPTIVISQNTYEVSSMGETIKVEINSNVEFSVSIPAAYSAWIQEAAELRALSTHTKYFTISANPETQSRTGEILFTSQEHNLTEKVTIQQKALFDDDYTTVHVPTKGTLASVLAENNLEASSIVLLKITGEINDVDMVGIRDMSNLKSLDISETNLTEVPAGTFQKLKNLKKVILPNTIKSINKKAFYQSGLQSIEIPASVETIGKSAFQGCTALTTVTFEKGSQLKIIEGDRNYDYGVEDCGAFQNCTSLTAIEIPASVAIIEDGAFHNCTALTTVTFEKGSQLKIIKGEDIADFVIVSYYGAFSNCTSLTSIEIPASVETIEKCAFQGCTALTTVTFEKGSQLKTIEGNLVTNAYDYDIVDQKGAFADCISLTCIEIPASVETIWAGAFHGCTALTTVTFEKGSQLKTIEGFSWTYSRSYSGAFSDCTSLTSIEIPASVEKIGVATFKGCTALTTVTFEKGSQLKEIGDNSLVNSYHGAFTDCTSLISIEIPASVETIGWNAFGNCQALTTVTFEKGSQLKTIWGGSSDVGAFSNCISLTSIEIPASVEVIRENAFKGCTALTTVTFEQGSQLKTFHGRYDTGVFYDCKSLTSIEIPASVETIEGATFKGCTALTTVTFEKGIQLKTIQGAYISGTFYGCTSLTSIEIPASVETIEKCAFQGCTALTTVTFESGSQLKNIKGGVEGNLISSTYYQCGAFFNLPNLRTVDMSACTQVEDIGMFAFTSCSNLQLFKIGTVTPPACTGAYRPFEPHGPFGGLPSTSILKVPAGSEAAYREEDGWKEFSSISALD